MEQQPGPGRAKPERFRRHAGLSLSERGPGTRVRAQFFRAERRDREEQVQGDRALRQASKRAHSPAGPRRSSLVSKYQNQSDRAVVLTRATDASFRLTASAKATAGPAGALRAKAEGGKRKPHECINDHTSASMRRIVASLFVTAAVV